MSVRVAWTVLLLAALGGALWLVLHEAPQRPPPAGAASESLEAPGLEGRAAPRAEEPLAPDAAHLVADLSSEDPAVRQAAFTALCALPRIPYDEGLARRMAAWLAEGRSGVRYAQIVLLRMGPAARAVVDPLLKHEDGLVRARVLYLYGGWPNFSDEPYEWPDLLPLLDDPQYEVRSYAMGVVSRGVPYDERLAAYLREQIVPSPGSAYYGPEVALARMGPKGIEHLLALLGDDDLVFNALGGLAGARPEDLRPVLSHLTPFMRQDEDEDVQLAALRVLRPFQGAVPEALPALREVLGGESFLVRREVLMILEAMGARAAPAVEEVLAQTSDSDARIVAAACDVLSQLEQPSREVLETLQVGIEGEAPDSAARALGGFGSAGVPYLRAAFDAGDADARYAVMAGVHEAGPVAASMAGRIRALLEQEREDWELVKRAALAAGRLGAAGSALVPAVLARTQDGTITPGVGAACLLSMGEHAHAPLRAALARKGTAATALEILATMGGATAFALEALAPHLGSKDPEQRLHAVLAVIRATGARSGLYGISPESDPALRARVAQLIRPLQDDTDREIRQHVETALEVFEELRTASR